MSTSSWMHGGIGKLILDVPATSVYPPIKVFDIREPNFVGVEYSGDKNDRQAQPRIWWEERLRKADTPPPMPRIQPRTRPALVANKNPPQDTSPKAITPGLITLAQTWVGTARPRPKLKIQPRKRR